MDKEKLKSNLESKIVDYLETNTDYQHIDKNVWGVVEEVKKEVDRFFEELE